MMGQAKTSLVSFEFLWLRDKVDEEGCQKIILKGSSFRGEAKVSAVGWGLVKNLGKLSLTIKNKNK